MRLPILQLMFLLFASYAYSQEEDGGDLSEKSYLAEVAYYNANYTEAEELFSFLKKEYLKRNDYTKAFDGSLGIARTKIALGQFTIATEECNEAIGFLSKLEKVDSARTSVINRIYGEAYLNKGLNELALEKLKVSEDFLLKRNDLRHADLMEEIGVAYWNNGNQILAKQYHNRVLQARLASLAEDDEEVGDSYLNLGLVEIQENEYVAALVYFKKALSIYEEIDEESGKLKLANVYTNMAFANFENGAYALAGTYFENVEEIYNQIYPGNHPNKAFIEANLGRVDVQQDNFDGALERFTAALEIYKNIYGEKHPEVADTYARIGRVYERKVAYKAALDSYQKAIYANLRGQSYQSYRDAPKLENYFNAEYLLGALLAKATVLEDLHYNKSLKARDINAALNTHILSDSLISRIKQIRISESDKIRTSAQSKEIYENGIRISIDIAIKSINKKVYHELAYQFFERSKASTLLEAINDTKAKNYADIPNEVLKQEETLINEIVQLENKVNQLLTEEEKRETSALLFNKNNEYRQFISNLESNYPAYYSLKYSSKLASSKSVQSYLKDNEVIMSYFISSKRNEVKSSSENRVLYTMILTSKKLEFRQTDLPDNFNTKITGFRNAIKYKAGSATKRLGRELFDYLIPNDIYEKYNFLTIIPDGVISTIPIEALIDHDGNYVIESAGINYDFSVNLYFENIKIKNKEIKKALAIAPIKFDSYRNVKLSTLPGTKREVEEIRLNGKGILDVNLWINENASENELKATTLQEYDIIHFATHGEVNESEPDRSRIFLYDDPNNEDDGFLYSSEIYNIKLNADLVTLSACETGLGKVAKGEGIIGLSRSLKYAGGKNLVVSLWTVADQSTSNLMIDFYQKQQINNFSYAMALRDAKLSLLYSEEFKAPYFWAPFILIGK